MTLAKILEIAAKGYDGDVSTMNDLYNPGDKLASFIVQEITETYNQSESTTEQLWEACRVIERAREDLNRTIAALEAAQ